MERRADYISKHAIDRYRERLGSQQSDEHIRAAITALLDMATEVSLKGRYKAAEFLKYECIARYYRFDSFIFVVDSTRLSVVTVYIDVTRFENLTAA